MLDCDLVLRAGESVLCGIVAFVLPMWQPSTDDIPERAFTRSLFIVVMGVVVVHVLYLVLFNWLVNRLV